MLNGEQYDVIGVMPASFRDFTSRPADLWTPLALSPEQFSDNNRTSEFLTLVARLKPAITVERARGEMKAFASQLGRSSRTTTRRTGRSRSRR